MTALATPPANLSIQTLDINQVLLDAIVAATQKGLMMSGMEAKCVGVSRVPGKQAGKITGMIGVHGSVSGFFTVNMSSQLAFQAVEGLLGEKFDKLTPQVIDSAGEVTNIIVGGIKAALANSEWAFSHITVPSVIVGDGYQVAFASGLELIDVVFEVENKEAILVTDRLMHITLSLLRL